MASQQPASYFIVKKSSKRTNQIQSGSGAYLTSEQPDQLQTVFTHETKAKHIDRFDDFVAVTDHDKRSLDKNDGDRLTQRSTKDTRIHYQQEVQQSQQKLKEPNISMISSKNAQNTDQHNMQSNNIQSMDSRSFVDVKLSKQSNYGYSMLMPGNYKVMQPQIPTQATMGIFQAFMGRRADQRQYERERLAMQQAALPMEQRSTDGEADGMTEKRNDLPFNSRNIVVKMPNQSKVTERLMSSKTISMASELGRLLLDEDKNKYQAATETNSTLIADETAHLYAKSETMSRNNINIQLTNQTIDDEVQLEFEPLESEPPGPGLVPDYPDEPLNEEQDAFQEIPVKENLEMPMLEWHHLTEFPPERVFVSDDYEPYPELDQPIKKIEIPPEETEHDEPESLNFAPEPQTDDEKYTLPPQAALTLIKLPFQSLILSDELATLVSDDVIDSRQAYRQSSKDDKFMKLATLNQSSGTANSSFQQYQITPKHKDIAMTPRMQAQKDFNLVVDNKLRKVNIEAEVIDQQPTEEEDEYTPKVELEKSFETTTNAASVSTLRSPIKQSSMKTNNLMFLSQEKPSLKSVRHSMNQILGLHKSIDTNNAGIDDSYFNNSDTEEESKQKANLRRFNSTKAPKFKVLKKPGREYSEGGSLTSRRSAQASRAGSRSTERKTMIPSITPRALSTLDLLERQSHPYPHTQKIIQDLSRKLVDVSFKTESNKDDKKTMEETTEALRLKIDQRLLASHKLLKLVDTQAAQKLLEQSEIKLVKEGQSLYKAGDQAHKKAYIVLIGKLSLKNEMGTNSKLGFVDSGETLGEEGVFEPDYVTRRDTAIAKEASYVIEIRKRNFYRLEKEFANGKFELDWFTLVNHMKTNWVTKRSWRYKRSAL